MQSFYPQLQGLDFLNGQERVESPTSNLVHNQTLT